MSDLESLKIDLKELKEGVTTLDFILDDTFFDSIDATEIKRGRVDAALSIRKTENYFHFVADLKGLVVIPCDRCLDDMEQQIETTDEMSVVEDDTEDGVVDISWWLYENMVLNIPIQHVHDTGKCNVAMLKVLEEHSATRSSDKDENNVNPMWAKLQGLKEKLN